MTKTDSAPVEGEPLPPLLPDFLLATWHPDTGPETLNLKDSPDRASLQILGSTGNGGRLPKPERMPGLATVMLS